jgi:tetratricopeptide (TPR) repeat protein
MRPDSAKLNTAAVRHSAHYLHVLGKAERLCRQGGAATKEGLCLFDLEWTNIQTGQAWAAGRAGEDDLAASHCNNYSEAGAYVLAMRQHPQAQIRWCETALTAARRLNQGSSEAVHLGNIGLAFAKLGDARRAIQYHEEQLLIAGEIGDRSLAGSALGNLGLAYMALGEVHHAIRCHEEALLVLRDASAPRLEGNVWCSLGLAYADLGQ